MFRWASETFRTDALARLMPVALHQLVSLCIVWTSRESLQTLAYYAASFTFPSFRSGHIAPGKCTRMRTKFIDALTESRQSLEGGSCSTASTSTAKASESVRSLARFGLRSSEASVGTAHTTSICITSRRLASGPDNYFRARNKSLVTQPVTIGRHSRLKIHRLNNF